MPDGGKAREWLRHNPGVTIERGLRRDPFKRVSAHTALQYAPRWVRIRILVTSGDAAMTRTTLLRQYGK